MYALLYVSTDQAVPVLGDRFVGLAELAEGGELGLGIYIGGRELGCQVCGDRVPARQVVIVDRVAVAVQPC